ATACPWYKTIMRSASRTGRKAMSNDEGCPPSGGPTKRFHDCLFGYGVQAAGWLLQDKERRIAQNGPRNRDPLFLSFAIRIVQGLAQEDQIEEGFRARSKDNLEALLCSSMVKIATEAAWATRRNCASAESSARSAASLSRKTPICPPRANRNSFICRETAGDCWLNSSITPSTVLPE